MRVLMLLCLFCLPAAASDGATGDEKALAIADQVMVALGGQKAYDETRYLTWKFFGKRLHVWDKWTGDARVEDGKGLVVILNVNSREGKAWQDSNPIEGEALAEKLQYGYEAWINDSYWLVMPYKLKDPGVTLHYSGERKDTSGADCDVLTLTFEEVGVTPENKYEVFVNKASHIVTQWNFFSKADDAEPRFTTPWANWQKMGNIMLSDDRGERKHSDVAVLDKVPEGTFSSPQPLEL